MTPDHPLSGSLERLDPATEWIEASLREPADDWLSARRLTEADGTALERLRDVALTSTGPADPRTVGAMMILRVAEVGRLAACLYRLERRVPELPPDVAFRPYTDDLHTAVAITSPRFACLPDDPDRGHPDAEPLPDLHALRRVLLERIEGYIAPVIEPISRLTHLGPRGLWAIAASGAVVSIAEAYDDAGEIDRAAAELAACMAHGGPLTDPPASTEILTRDGHRHLVFTLGACCRVYRWPGGREKCAACPIRTRDDRIARQTDPAARHA